MVGPLVENLNITTLIIEAGNDDHTDPHVYDIYQDGHAFGTSLDWSYPAKLPVHESTFLLLTYPFSEARLTIPQSSRGKTLRDHLPNREIGAGIDNQTLPR